MNSKRLLQHILFWSIYYIICLYNELYLSDSFTTHPSFELFLQSSLTVFLLVVTKVVVVYFIFYKLIPSWTEEKNNFKFLMSAILSLAIGTLALRLVIQFIIWPYVYAEETGPISLSSTIARYFYTLLDLLQVAGVAVSIKLFKMRLDAIKKEKSLVQERSKAEVLHLKSQTNPHFLFNTLNSIYSLSRSKSEKAPDAIMQLSKILRYTIYDSDKNTVSIAEEIKIIKDYIALQQLRFGKRITIDFKSNINSDFTQIVPLLLLPIIENTYKHCDENDATVIFDLSLTNNVLNLKASNPASQKEVLSNGTGLQNLKRQLALLYKEHTLKFFLRDNVFTLELTINLNSYAGNELFDS